MLKNNFLVVFEGRSGRWNENGRTNVARQRSRVATHCTSHPLLQRETGQVVSICWISTLRPLAVFQYYYYIKIRFLSRGLPAVALSVVPPRSPCLPDWVTSRPQLCTVTAVEFAV